MELRGGGRKGDRDSHAVVLGGGIAGLFGAFIAARHFDTVTLVEPDDLPGTPGVRPGVPQGVHVHGLLRKGLDLGELLLPGFAEELRAHGAPTLDAGADIAVRNALGWSARFRAGLPVISTSRALVEFVIRQRVFRHPNVTVLVRHRAKGLVGQEGRVTGVRLRGEEEPAGPVSTMRADLVVDATGRSSRAPSWLMELGYAETSETVIDAGIAYATRTFRIPANAPSDWKAVYAQLGAPDQTRGGIIAPVEGSRWLVTLTGAGADRPSSRDEGFLPFARSLASPAIADAITDAEPLTRVTGSRSTSNRRRHFDRLPKQPGGFVAIGDAACCFNPIYAQGMTSAALGAQLLDECLARSGGNADSVFAHDFTRRLTRLNNVCWSMSTGADIRFPETTGPQPTPSERLVARFIDRTLRAGNRDPHVQDTFVRVANLMLPARALAAPRHLARVIRSGGRRTRAPVPAQPPPVRGTVPSHATTRAEHAT